ncbi:VanZ family protein [Dyadobacter sp. NIV53]|uniref:VanZ family protein n=1 Tax=Dyadobacter sp. NIV53 TaxID=2861765 RepID=UPI001C88D7DA|nr:VanZ family protein [Dyadobacter sp. NIV53]
MVVVFFQSVFKFIHKNPWIAWLWSFLILAACTWPGKDIPAAPVAGFDKIVHTGLFAVWIILWRGAYPEKSSVTLILSGMAYGLGLEFYQQLLPFDRTFDWWDAVADAAGVLLGFTFKSMIIDHYLQRLY